VTKPLEAIVKGIDGVEHVYSQTQDDRVMVTARFLVGAKAEDAILRVHEKIRANYDRIPVGIPEPLIVGRGINDVAIVVLTLSPKPAAAARWTDKDPYELADKLRAELMKVDNVGLTYVSGGNPQQIRVEPDPEKLALYGVTLQQLVGCEGRQPFLPRRRRARCRRDPHGRGRPDADGRARHRPSAPDLALQPARLRARRRFRRDRSEPAGASGVERRSGRRRRVGAHARGQPCARQARGRERRRGRRQSARAAGKRARSADPGRRDRHRHPRLRGDRERKGERAAVPSWARHRVDRRDDRGMLDVAKRVDAHDWGALPKPVIRLHGQPEDESKPALLWDGEWEITYVTFRDMGAAFGAAILGIYVLVVAQFGSFRLPLVILSFRLPLVILTPIPLTLIGIVLGHWLLGAPFTATSMIGFIALAGIIVRNSILLVDFIRHGAGQGKTLREVLLEAGAVRFKPILLTALAAMIGAATILLDPIFQGLVISLLFGLASSTLLTVLVIPAIYVVLRDADRVVTA
jgi:multidrug efflux pump subunit AcrB